MRRHAHLKLTIRALSICFACAIGSFALATSAVAGKTRVAVASNFMAAAKAIGVLFEKQTEHSVIFSFGATGPLSTQITQGAPYDVFLAADRARPTLAIERGYAVRGSRFTYAEGRLALFTRDTSREIDSSTLSSAIESRVAIANPVIAPYGAAAVAAMQALGVYEALQPRLVRGTNIAQAYQFAYTGNAAFGFVALSQIAGRTGGSHWVVPAELHPAIAQDAVLLVHGAENAAARAFLAFLKGDGGRRVTEMFGYGAGP